jgi:DNA-binding transcriptional LysR family regulator
MKPFDVGGVMGREDLGGLAMFLAVAEEKSFTRAAARLGVSQSALSHSMRRLEAKLGLRLLTRTTRSVSPTIAGERLLATLGPALDDIDDMLSSLTELRERPAGTIRITTSKHAARTILWPVVERLTAENPDIVVELSVDSGLTDIVADRFDAGVRLGERLEKDMIAVRIGPQLRMAAVGSPAYFAKHGTPITPDDLARHSCINLRFTTSGGLYVWEFEKAGRELKVKVEGQLVLNDVDLTVDAAVAGRGIAFMIEDHATDQIANGHLVRVLEDWCEPFDGHYLYYPSRRQPSPAFSLFLETLRFRK